MYEIMYEAVHKSFERQIPATPFANKMNEGIDHETWSSIYFFWRSRTAARLE